MINTYCFSALRDKLCVIKYPLQGHRSVLVPRFFASRLINYPSTYAARHVLRSHFNGPL